MVLNVDPNNTPDARPIVEACFKAKVYVVTWWNKPADLHPWDFDPYYISHIEFDGVTNGGYITEALFKAMGDEGGFVAVGGMISNSAAIDRRKGMMETLKKHPRSSFSTSRLAIGSRKRLSTSPRPGSRASETRSRACGPLMTIWAPARSKRCALKA